MFPLNFYKIKPQSLKPVILCHNLSTRRIHLFWGKAFHNCININIYNITIFDFIDISLSHFWILIKYDFLLII